jgi:hypothetical protein
MKRVTKLTGSIFLAATLSDGIQMSENASEPN